MPEDAGALLVRSGLIAEEELTSALAKQAQRGGTIGEHLVLAGVIDDDRLAELYRTQLLVPQVTLRQLQRISKDIIQRIPADMATEHRCVPVSYDRDGNLTVAMAEPSNTQTVDEIGFFTTCYVVRAVATQSQIAWALAHYYGRLTELGEKLLDDPSGTLIPGPMPPRRSLTPAHGWLHGTSTPHTGADPTRAARQATNSETTGGNISGEFVVAKAVAAQHAAPSAPVADKTARLPSSRPIPMAGERAGRAPSASDSAVELGGARPETGNPAPTEGGASAADAVQQRFQRTKLPLPADATEEKPGTTSSPIPVIIEDDDSPPTYRPRPTGRLGQRQRHISFFQEDTPPTREIEAMPMPQPTQSNDPELVARFGEVSVRSQPIQIIENSLPAVVIAIDDEPLIDDLPGAPGADNPPDVPAHDRPPDAASDHEPAQAPPGAAAAQPPSETPADADVDVDADADRPPTTPSAGRADSAAGDTDIGTASTIPTPVTGKRSRRKRTRTFQGLGIGDAPPIIPQDDPADHADDPGTDPEALPHGLAHAPHGAEPVAASASTTSSTTAPTIDSPVSSDGQFDDFQDGFDSGNWNEIFSDGAPVRAPDMPTLRVTMPTDAGSDPLRAWQNVDGPVVSVIDSIQKAAEAAAEAHARSHRDTDLYPTPASALDEDDEDNDDGDDDGPTERNAIMAPPPGDADDRDTGEFSAGDNLAGDGDGDDDGDREFDPTYEMDVAELPVGVDLPDEFRSPDDVAQARGSAKPGTITGEPTSRVERPPATVMDHGAISEDEQWGPPGTTIPPPFLGAVSYDDTGNLTGIPLITDDLDEDVSDIVDAPLPDAPTPVAPLPSDGTVAPIHNPGSGRHERAESAVQAPLSLYDSENVTPQVLREFESSQESLAEPLRHLQLADTRDAVIQIMINHMTEAHRNVAFFVVKSERLEPFRVIGGTGQAANDPNRLSKIWLRLDFPSTFQDIVSTRLPYRGPITDQASRDFVYKTFGAVGETMLGLPLTIRERVVGVLYGDNNTRHVFVQNLGVLVRAAGGALERIIRNARNQPG